MTHRTPLILAALLAVAGASVDAQQRVNQGGLTVGDVREATLSSGEEHTWTLTVSGEQTVTIAMTRIDSSIDPYIELEETNGREIASNDDGGDGLNSRLTERLRAGTYTIVAREFGRNDSGRYRIEVQGSAVAQTAQPGSIPIAVGQAVDSFLTDGSQQPFSLEVTRSTRVRIDLERTAGSDIDPYLELEDQFGNRIETDDDGGSGLDSRITRMLNPGSYTIIARDLGNNSSGPFRLTVADLGSMAITGIPITVGQTLDSYINEGQEQPFVLTIDAPTQVVIDMIDTSTLDPFITLNDAGGNEIETDDDGGSGLNSRISRQLQPGRYQIIARDLGNNSAGSFRLSVSAGQRVNEIPLAVGQQYDGFLQEGVEQPFILTVASGQQVRIDFEATNDADIDPYLVLRDDRGNQIETDDDGGSGFNSRITRFLDAGRYRIIVSDLFGDGRGSYRVSISGGQTVNAIPINVGQSYDGYMQPGQPVYYELNLSSGRQVTIEFMRTGEASFDPYLRLEDARGAEIDTNDDGGSTLDSRISRYLDPGTYIIIGQDLWEDDGGSFRISVY